MSNEHHANVINVESDHYNILHITKNDCVMGKVYSKLKLSKLWSNI